MIVVDDGVVAHIVQGFSYAVHVHITGVGNYLLVPFPFGNLSTHVAEMDVEDFALFPEVPNALEDIFPRFVAGAHAKGHPVVRGADFRKEAVKCGKVVENLWHAVEAGNRRVVAVHRNLDANTFGYRHNVPERFSGCAPRSHRGSVHLLAAVG